MTDQEIIERLTEQTNNTIKILKLIRMVPGVPKEAAELMDLKIITAEQTLDIIQNSAKLEALKHAS